MFSPLMNPNIPSEMYENDVKSCTFFENVAILGGNCPYWYHIHVNMIPTLLITSKERLYPKKFIGKFEFKFIFIIEKSFCLLVLL